MISHAHKSSLISLALHNRPAPVYCSRTSHYKWRDSTTLSCTRLLVKAANNGNTNTDCPKEDEIRKDVVSQYCNIIETDASKADRKSNIYYYLLGTLFFQ